VEEKGELVEWIGVGLEPHEVVERGEVVGELVGFAGLYADDFGGWGVGHSFGS